MREILFRAKHREWNEWVEGDLIHEPFGDCIQFIKNECRSKIKVNPETVCQYTGLTDKNGRKIFEGDIVQENVEDAEETGTDKFIYSVLYSEEHTAFTTSDVIGEGYFEPLAEYINSNAEVIGNIFDNPELIG